MVLGTTSHDENEVQQKLPPLKILLSMELNSSSSSTCSEKSWIRLCSSSITNDTNKNTDTNTNSSSFRGSTTSTIPFMWESAPGTPKHTFNDTFIPPLTPPPSFKTTTTTTKSPKKKHPKNNLFHTIFPKLNARKKTNLVSPKVSSSSWSYSTSSSPSCSSSSSSSNSVNQKHRGTKIELPKSPFCVGFDDHDEKVKHVMSPTSTLCFGEKRGANYKYDFLGCFRW